MNFKKRQYLKNLLILEEQREAVFLDGEIKKKRVQQLASRICNVLKEVLSDHELLSILEDEIYNLNTSLDGFSDLGSTFVDNDLFNEFKKIERRQLIACGVPNHTAWKYVNLMQDYRRIINSVSEGKLIDFEDVKILFENQAEFFCEASRQKTVNKTHYKESFYDKGDDTGNARNIFARSGLAIAGNAAIITNLGADLFMAGVPVWSAMSVKYGGGLAALSFFNPFNRIRKRD